MGDAEWTKITIRGRRRRQYGGVILRVALTVVPAALSSAFVLGLNGTPDEAEVLDKPDNASVTEDYDEEAPRASPDSRRFPARVAKRTGKETAAVLWRPTVKTRRRRGR